MKIKQVEELVGITRKNIRFYEEQGLLNVERAENGYREYHTADIADPLLYCPVCASFILLPQGGRSSIF